MPKLQTKKQIKMCFHFIFFCLNVLLPTQPSIFTPALMKSWNTKSCRLLIWSQTCLLIWNTIWCYQEQGAIIHLNTRFPATAAASKKIVKQRREISSREGKSWIKNQIKVMASFMNNAADVYFPGSRTVKRSSLAKSLPSSPPPPAPGTLCISSIRVMMDGVLK